MPFYALSLRERLLLKLSGFWYRLKTRGVCFLLGCKLNERGVCQRCGASMVPYLDGMCDRVLLPVSKRLAAWIEEIQVGHETDKEAPAEILMDLAKDCRAMAEVCEEETQRQAWDNMAANLELVARKLKEV